MKKLLFIMLLFSSVIFGQQNRLVYTNDMMDTLASFLAGDVDSAITAQLGAASIGDADSLGGYAASSYLKKADSTIYATQYDLTQISGTIDADTITALRTDINTNTGNISTNTTNISALTTLANNKFYLGNVSNVATEVTLSGDVTSSNDGTMAIGTGVIVNADVNTSAAIDATKIADGSISNTEFQYLNGASSNLQTQITALGNASLQTLTNGKIFIGDGGGLPAEQTVSGDITLTNAGVAAIGSGVIVNADVNASAAIAYSKLNLSGSIVSADITDGTIVTGDLSAGTLVDANINASANITATKLGTGIISNDEFNYLNGVTSAIQTQITGNDDDITAIQTVNTAQGDTLTAHKTKINTSISNDATHTANIATNASDIDALETLANGKIYMGNSSNVATEVTPSGDATISNTGVISLTGDNIVNADINSSAAIDASKIADGSVSSTEFQYLNGVTSAVQTQITNITTLADGKIYLGNSGNSATEVTLTGDVTTTNAGVTSITAGVIVDADVNSGANIDASKLGTGVISNTELNYLNGVTSAIQTQINNLVPFSRGGSFSIPIIDPQSSEIFIINRAKYAYTIDSVSAILITDGTGNDSLSFNIKHGSNNLFTSSVYSNEYTTTGSFSITDYDLYTTFSDATVSAGEFVSIHLGTLVNTVNEIMITVYYTED